MTNPTSNRKGGSDGTAGGGSKTFQPERYLEQRDGAAWLPLKWRLAWLRFDQPQASIVTKLVKHKDGVAIFRAEVKLPDGAIATGWGSRRDPYATDGASNDLGLNYITEAENQALERALALLGYGMEYATDFDKPKDGDSIPLRYDAENEDEDETASIEVPMNDIVGDEEAEEIGGTVNLPARLSVQVANGKDEPVEAENDSQEEDENADEEDHEDEDEAEAPIEEKETVRPNLRPIGPDEPTPLRAVFEEPARFNAEPTPLRPSRQSSTVANPPTPITAHPAATRRPGPTSPEPVATPPVPPTPITNVAVEERLKGISDSQLVLAIKQIFHEARRLHNLSEDAVDRSSLKRYGVPVNGLNIDQAEEYLERIKTAPRTPRK